MKAEGNGTNGSHRGHWGAVAVLALGLVTTPVQAQEADPIRFYITAGGSYVTVGKEFDGNGLVVGGSSVEVVPDLDPGLGFVGGLGLQSGNIAVELGYNRTAHDAEAFDAPFDATRGSIYLDIRYLFLKRSPIRPLLSVGLEHVTLKVEDGSLGDTGAVEDARYKGLAARLGGGVDVEVFSRLAVQVLALWRAENFGRVKGVDSGDLDDEIEGGGLTATASIKLLF